MRFMAGILAVAAVFGLSACGNSDDVAQQQEQATLVQMAEVKTLNAQNSFSFPAKVVPKTTVDISFRVAGRLQSVNLPEGQYVKKGQVIAKLDSEPFDRAVRMAQVRLKQAKLELNRVQAIATRGIGSEKSVDNAQVSYDLAEIDLENAKANSQPMAPAPRIASDFGGAGRSNTVSLVSGRASIKPGMGGMAALAPVHSAIRRAFSGVSSTQICPPVLKLAEPRNTSTPASV